VNAEGKVELRVLKTDRSLGDKWLVSEGLKPGDQLIVEGLQKIQPGMSVKVVPTDKPAAAAAAAPSPAAKK